MFYRRLQEVLETKKMFYWGYLYLTNLNVYQINLYLTLYLTNLRQIQNQPNNFKIRLILKLKQHSILRIKISDDF